MLKRRFSFLTDEDFEYTGDDKTTMLTALAAKLKKSKTELSDLFAELQRY